ncbi:hypothetical protein ACFY05_31880 [Microtetraspora fusca]|uniref:Uncharacterized protein n=1 Tax=Microtetraspora fusca TaxID=1997 RepID=A0ABW6VEC3_MICFU
MPARRTTARPGRYSNSQWPAELTVEYGPRRDTYNERYEYDLYVNDRKIGVVEAATDSRGFGKWYRNGWRLRAEFTSPEPLHRCQPGTRAEATAILIRAWRKAAEGDPQ